MGPGEEKLLRQEKRSPLRDSGTRCSSSAKRSLTGPLMLVF